MSTLMDSISKKKFAVYSLLTNNVVGILHRETTTNFYYYTIVPKWMEVRGVRTEKKIKKESHLILVLIDKVNRGAYAIVNAALRQKTMNFAMQPIRFNAHHPLHEVMERLTLALGNRNYALSLHRDGAKHNSHVTSIWCNNREDALIAELIANQV